VKSIAHPNAYIDGADRRRKRICLSNVAHEASIVRCEENVESTDPD